MGVQAVIGRQVELGFPEQPTVAANLVKSGLLGKGGLKAIANGGQVRDVPIPGQDGVLRIGLVAYCPPTSTTGCQRIIECPAQVAICPNPVGIRSGNDHIAIRQAEHIAKGAEVIHSFPALPEGRAGKVQQNSDNKYL